MLSLLPRVKLKDLENRNTNNNVKKSAAMTIPTGNSYREYYGITSATSTSSSTTSNVQGSRHSNPIDIPNSDANVRRRRSDRHVGAHSLSEKDSSTYLMKVQAVTEHYEWLQKEQSKNEMGAFFTYFPFLEKHAHIEGILNGRVMLDQACKQSQIHYDYELDKPVSVKSPITDRHVHFKNLPEEPTNQFLAKMGDPRNHTSVTEGSGATQSYTNPTRESHKFFKQCDVRSCISNEIGFEALSKCIYDLYREEGVLYAELMTVLIPYSRLSDTYAELWKGTSYAEFIALPQVQGWIDDYVKRCQTVLDEFHSRLNNNRNEWKKINCFKIDIDNDVDPTICFIYELMRNFEPSRKFEFFMMLAAVCELIKRERVAELNEGKTARVVAFTLCGPQGTSNSLVNEGDICDMLEFMESLYTEKKKDTEEKKEFFRFNPHFSETNPNDITSDYKREESRILDRATCSVGHGTSAFDRIPLLLEKNLAVEVCLLSNKVTLLVQPHEHVCKDFVKRGVPVVLCADDPGIIGSTLKDNYVEAAISCKFTLEQMLQFARDAATYSHRRGESIYEPQVSGAPRKSVLNQIFKMEEIISGNFSDEAKQFLASSDRAKLEIKVERGIHKFIEKAYEKIEQEKKQYKFFSKQSHRSGKVGSY